MFPFPPTATDLRVPVRDAFAEDLPDSDGPGRAEEADEEADGARILRTHLEDFEEIVSGK